MCQGYYSIADSNNGQV